MKAAIETAMYPPFKAPTSIQVWRYARRALGDIGNLVGPFNTRCNVGKENATSKAVLTEKAAQVGQGYLSELLTPAAKL